MFAAMVPCPQYQNRLLPVAADSMGDFGTKIVVVEKDFFIDHLIQELQCRSSSATGMPPAFLALDCGIQIEMKKAGICPTAMARMLIANASIYHPALVSELLRKTTDSDHKFDACFDTLQIGTPEKRLADRLGRRTPIRAPAVVVLGRMLGLHAISHGERNMCEFTD
jgi:hypothetical protein